MIKFKQNTPTAGDCTPGYEVTLDREYSVREFMNYVLSNESEWGYIGIDNNNSIFGSPTCEFKHGKLLNELPTEYLEKKVVNVSASGGWSRMDYKLKIAA